MFANSALDDLYEENDAEIAAYQKFTKRIKRLNMSSANLGLL